MNFTSLVFFVFLPITVLIYWLTPDKYRWVVLLVASYVFYAFYNVWLISLILITTLVSYLSGLCGQNAKTKRGKKAAVGFTVAVCLILLFVFKYLDFALSGLFALFRLCGADVAFNGFNIILPMGISFYIFQTMSYTFDVYRGKIKAERHLGYYALFVVFFPQLVAGPIERPGDLIPQLKAPRSLDKESFSVGIKFILIGYVQKIIVADFIARFVDAAYNDVHSSGGLALIIATVLFAVQIYCDFSGYSQIAIGCARLMGINLTQNFRRPYLACSPREFWRRWHISLTRWFTDYIYIPLGGNRKGTVRRCLNIMIVFLLSGLWHGANLTFVVWGGLHGLMLVIQSLIPKRRSEVGALKPLFVALTFTAVCFTWIFFRSATLSDAGEVIRSVFSDWKASETLTALGMSLDDVVPCILALLMLLLSYRIPALVGGLPLTRSVAGQVRTALVYVLIIVTVVTCRCYVADISGVGSFIYFSF